MKHYYELLEVTPFSSISEIKHAFRKKAKAIHPDLRAAKANSNTNLDMAMLLEAYHYLLEKHNSFVDLNVFKSKKIKEFNYRTWLQERKDYESRAKLIVFDLFHQYEKDAIKEYLHLLTLELPFTFSRYFSRADFMDYGFVLAEELFFEKYYYESFMLIKDIIALEEEKPYFMHFFPELIKLCKNCLNALKYSKNYEKVFECYKIALDMNFSPKQKEAFSKQLAKIVNSNT